MIGAAPRSENSRTAGVAGNNSGIARRPWSRVLFKGAVFLLAAFVCAIAGGAIHPFGPVKEDSAEPLFSGTRIDAANFEHIRQSCGNCHSEHGQWPWYSYMAPASWLVEKDVSDARAHLNISRWHRYTVSERITLLTAIGAVLRTDAMPPQRYLALHPEAALSPAERNALYEWTKTERRRLRPLVPEN